MSLQFPPGLIESVLNSDPPWLSCTLSHLHSSLSMLTCDELRAAVLHISTHFTPGKHYDKLSCINAILDHFDSRRTLFSSCGLKSVYASLQELSLNSTSDMPLSRPTPVHS
jgi:hypothetical protein